jgi:hypothetical protein
LLFVSICSFRLWKKNGSECWWWLMWCLLVVDDDVGCDWTVLGFDCFGTILFGLMIGGYWQKRLWYGFDEKIWLWVFLLLMVFCLLPCLSDSIPSGFILPCRFQFRKRKLLSVMNLPFWSPSNLWLDCISCWKHCIVRVQLFGMGPLKGERR